MLTGFSNIPRLVTIEDALDDFYGNVFDVACPFSSPFLHSPEACRYRRRSRKPKDHKFRIVVTIGKHYEPKDIKLSLEGNNLTVLGDAVEKVSYGSNTHHFERKYVVPDDVELSTMKSELNQIGELLVTFERKHVEPKKEVENLSTDTEYHTKFNLPGFKPEELSVKLIGRDLVIEGEHKSEKASENGHSYSTHSGYISRRIHLDDSVEIEKIRAVICPDGGIEIKAPRDKTKAIPEERQLTIEQS